jgi:hypothetical protein
MSLEMNKNRDNLRENNQRYHLPSLGGDQCARALACLAMALHTIVIAVGCGIPANNKKWPKPETFTNKINDLRHGNLRNNPRQTRLNPRRPDKPRPKPSQPDARSPDSRKRRFEPTLDNLYALLCGIVAVYHWFDTGPLTGIYSPTFA